MAALWEGDFFLGKGLDARADDVDAALVRGVEFEDGFFVGGAEKGACETENGGGFADTGHAGDDEVGHVTVARDDLETLDGFFVADDVGEDLGAVLFYPGGGG